MDGRIKAKRQLIRDFRKKIEEADGLLKTYLDGERSGEAEIIQLQHEIAELRRVSAIVEKQLAELKDDD